jgi:hypothetical protein
MRLTPIFDTSALINLSRRDDSLDSAMKRLKSRIPSHGCPLSFVTVMELFHGLCNGKAEKLDHTLKPLLLAARISRKQVLRTPLTFAEWELFQTEEAFGHQPRRLVDWLEKIEMPRFSERFAAGEIEMDFEGTERIFGLVKERNAQTTEEMLDRVHPSWREERRNGSALPESKREQFKREMPFEKWKGVLPELLVRQMHVAENAANVDRTRTGCDAYFTYTINLLRDSILGNYRFEDNPNDFHDGLQFLYLIRPKFCLVTDDRPSLDRTRQSSQRTRIMSLDEFLSTAA